MLQSLRRHRYPLPAASTRIRVRGGYHPDTVHGRVGEPLRLTFHREETAACSERVVFPALGKSAMLPPYHDVTVELRPEHAGEYAFTCQMGMLLGRLIVEEAGTIRPLEMSGDDMVVLVEASVRQSLVRRTLRRTWAALVAGWGVLIGLAPHVLHHVGPLAGAALLAGSAGTLLFGGIGFVAAAPFLIRLHRRFRTWRAPAIALAVFAVMFSISSFVIGPAISDGDEPPRPGVEQRDHEQHH